MHSSTVNKEQFVTLDRAKWEHENTTQCIRCILVTFLFLFFFFHYCAVRRCDTISFITSFLGFSTFLFCSLSDLSARPPLSIVLRSDEIGLRRASGALCFINSTSPLKDRPLTKLLFKEKKIHTCVGVERVCRVRVCVRARACTYTYMHTCASMAIQEMIHPTPGLADNFTVSWSQSLCESHFLWGTVTAATAALYSSGGERQWKTHNGCIVAVSKISSMNQQQKSNNQAYFHIINRLCVTL